MASTIFCGSDIQRQKELLAAFTREGDGTYTLEKREGPWVGGEINDWFYSDCRYGSYKDLLDDIKAEHGSAFFDRLRAAKSHQPGLQGDKKPDVPDLYPGLRHGRPAPAVCLPG